MGRVYFRTAPESAVIFGDWGKGETIGVHVGSLFDYILWVGSSMHIAGMFLDDSSMENHMLSDAPHP